MIPLTIACKLFVNVCTGRSSESCTQGAERTPKYVLSMMTFWMQVLEGLHPNDIREINSYMKFSLMKLWIQICFSGSWMKWIMNENGDFAYVVPGTLRFWLTKRNPMVEFKLIGDKCVRSEIEDGHQVVFTFVRGDGNRCGFKMWSIINIFDLTHIH